MAAGRCYGFRFSLSDGVFILLCAAATWALRGSLDRAVWLFPVVVAHFFLFCNVFRVRRSLELIWAAVFLVNAFAWMLADAFSWPGVLAVQTPITAAFIVAEIKSPDYRGIFARSLNPRLDERSEPGTIEPRA